MSRPRQPAAPAQTGVAQKRMPRRKRQAVELLPPAAEAARDEGPRLIPLEGHAQEPSRLEHYLELADKALGAGQKKHRPLKLNE